ncbi:MAG: 16S rRNA (guanine(527)-N(7))-methyltransferase RsmG [Anaerolineae bacterium]|nr:16S rRNA (guanine(527)-N(7))-methyltransferase RsmG [Anaerolineae bacterium]
MEKLVRDARALFNVHLTGPQVKALTSFERELLDWNKKFNLTAIRDVVGIRTKHFLDSFSCVLAWKANPPDSLIDIGTGAGFPGIPLKIIYPNTKVVLVESIGKKARFCRHVVDLLGLENIEVIQIRAETLGHMEEHREKYDWAIARAVAKMRVLSEYMLPLVRVGGSMLAQKGESGPAEYHQAETAIKKLGGELRQLLPLTLPGVVEERHLILVDKIGLTPLEYPRKSGVPTKNPL